MQHLCVLFIFYSLEGFEYHRQSMILLSRLFRNLYQIYVWMYGYIYIVWKWVINCFVLSEKHLPSVVQLIFSFVEPQYMSLNLLSINHIALVHCNHTGTTLHVRTRCALVHYFYYYYYYFHIIQYDLVWSYKVCISRLLSPSTTYGCTRCVH